MVLINGSNFIDGANFLNSGFFLIVFCNLLYIYSNNNLNVNLDNIYLIIITLFIFIIYNLFSKSFLGDSGSYVLSFYTGFFLIDLYNQNLSISPYYIAILLWYPTFENFFTFIRRLIIEKNKVNLADNLHLHHLLFIFLNKKIKNNKILNSVTGLIINTFNLMIIIISNNFIYETKKLLLLFCLAISIYSIFYYLLKKKYLKTI